MSILRTASPLSFRRLAFFGHSANDIYWFILPVVLPHIINDYRLNYAGAGAILSLYLTVVAIFSIVTGRLSDSFSPERLIGIGFFAASVSFLLAAGSSLLVLLNLALAIAAVGVSVFHPAIYGMADKRITADRGRFFGRFESFGSGAVIAVLILSGLLLPGLSWRGVMAIVVLPGLVAGYLFVKAPRYGSPVEKPKIVEKSPAGSRWHFALFLISNLLRFITVMAVLSFVPTFLSAQGDLPLGAAELVTGAYFLGGFIGARLFGALADRVNPLRLSLVLVASIPPLVLLLPGVETVPLSIATLFLFGAAAIGCIPLQNLLMRRFRSSLAAGHAFGVLLGVMTVAQALSPALFGLSADRLGLSESIRLFSIPAVGGTALLAYLTVCD